MEFRLKNFEKLKSLGTPLYSFMFLVELKKDSWSDFIKNLMDKYFPFGLFPLMIC